MENIDQLKMVENCHCRYYYYYYYYYYEKVEVVENLEAVKANFYQYHYSL